MTRNEEIRAREQAATESLISRLAYCMDGGYTTHDTIRSLCQEAMITINRLTAKVELLEADYEKARNHATNLTRREEALERALRANYGERCYSCKSFYVLDGEEKCREREPCFDGDCWEFAENRFAEGGQS